MGIPNVGFTGKNEVSSSGLHITQTSGLGDTVPHMSETHIGISANGVEQSSARRRPFWYPAVVVSSVAIQCFVVMLHTKSYNM
jgi:hypothetical protein